MIESSVINWIYSEQLVLLFMQTSENIFISNLPNEFKQKIEITKKSEPPLVSGKVINKVYSHLRSQLFLALLDGRKKDICPERKGVHIKACF